MELPDPPLFFASHLMKVLFLGGEKSGKTSLLSRCLDIPSQNILEIEQGIAIHVRGGLQFWDISGRFRSVSRSVHDYIFSSTDGILLVLDSSSQDGIVDCLHWISLLKHYIRGNIPIILLANKADSATKYVHPLALDQIVERYFLVDWFWTVGHTHFGDYDSRRGSQTKQLAVNEVLDRLLKAIHNKEIETKNNMFVLQQFEPLWSTSLQTSIPTTLQDGMNNVYEVVEEIEEPSSVERKPRLTGWEFYGGVMSREVSENYLKSAPIGSFLLRRSDLNFQLRIVMVSQESTIIHIPIKLIKQETERIDNQHVHSVRNEGSKPSYCVGRKELKGLQFDNIFEILQSLRLDPQNGVKFTRVAKRDDIFYSLTE